MGGRLLTSVGRWDHFNHSGLLAMRLHLGDRIGLFRIALQSSSTSRTGSTDTTVTNAAGAWACGRDGN